MANGNVRLTNGAGFTTANSLIREINSASGSGNQFVTSAIGFNIGDFSNAGFLTFSTANYASTPTERMRITQTGQVGIGTASPEAHLTVSGTANAVDGAIISIYETSTGNDARLRIVQDVGAAYYDATYASGSNQHIWKIGGTERMRLNASGNVGIGVTPSAWSAFTALQVNHGALSSTAVGNHNVSLSANAYFDGSNWRYIGSSFATEFRQNGGAFQWYQAPTGTAGNTIGFTQAMTLDSSGNLLVGLTTPQGGTVGDPVGISLFGSSAPGTAVFTRDNVNSVVYINNKTSGGGLVAFYNGGASVGSITSNGTNTTYGTASDSRLKHDIVDAPDAASLIDAIQVRSFKWNSDNSEQRYGMVAQELLEVAPEAVSQPADPDDMMGVDYSKLVPMLVKEIQSLRARVAQLEGN